MGLTPATSMQIPDNAILDFYNKQTYLGNAYLVNTNVQTIASDSSETALLVVANPSSNVAGQPTGNPQANLSLFNGVRKLIVGGDGATSVTFRFYLNPTISGGTPITPSNLRTGSSSTSKMTATLLPTASAKGTFLAALSVNYQEIDSAVMFIVDPGASLLITAEPGAVDTDVVAELSWYEI